MVNVHGVSRDPAHKNNHSKYNEMAQHLPNQ